MKIDVGTLEQLSIRGLAPSLVLSLLEEAEDYFANLEGKDPIVYSPSGYERYCVATERDTILAVAILHTPYYTTHPATLSHLYVIPAARRTSIGTAVVRQSSRYINAIGYPSLRVDVSPHNNSVTPFYNSTGATLQDCDHYSTCNSLHYSLGEDHA